MHAEDDAKQSSADMDTMLNFVVAEGYFETLGARLLHGRTFTAADMEDGHAVVIVDRKMAEAYWPGEDPIGKRIGWGANPDGAWSEVVGVVETAAPLRLLRGRAVRGVSPR